MKKLHEKYLNKRYSSKKSPFFARSFDKLPGRFRRMHILQRIVDRADESKLTTRSAKIVMTALRMAAMEMGGHYEGEKAGRKADTQIKKLITKMKKKPSRIKAQRKENKHARK